jgi:hypothetical protein
MRSEIHDTKGVKHAVQKPWRASMRVAVLGSCASAAIIAGLVGCTTTEWRDDPADVTLRNLCSVPVLAAVSTSEEMSGWKIQPGLEPILPEGVSSYVVPLDLNQPGSTLFLWVVPADATDWGDAPVEIGRDEIERSAPNSGASLTIGGEMCPPG